MADKRIAISEENREWLKSLKRGDDTYDDVLDDLRNEDYERAEASVSITPELDEDAVDGLIERLEERLNEVEVTAPDGFEELEALQERIERIESSADTIEERTGAIDRKVENLR